MAYSPCHGRHSQHEREIESDARYNMVQTGEKVGNILDVLNKAIEDSKNVVLTL